MKFPSQEKGPQVFVDEQQRVPENKEYAELQKTEEFEPQTELFRPEELQEPYASKPSEERRKRQQRERDAVLLSKYVVTAAVAVFTSAVAVGAITLTDSFSLRLQEENISFNAIECVFALENPDDLGLEVSLSQPKGEPLASQPITEDAESYSVTFEDLTPETEYVLTVTDQSGKERFTHTFTTDPFVTFSPHETDENKLNFTLHEKLSTAAEFSPILVNEEGLKFYSAVVAWEEFTGEVFTGVIYLDTLYAGEYSFTAEVMFLTEGADGEEEVWAQTYEKKMTLGSLQTLEYEASIEDGAVIFEYVSGDIGPYTQQHYVEFYQNGEWVGISTDAGVFSDDGLSLSFTLSADTLIPVGQYTLVVLGYIEEEDYGFWNEIWIGEIIIETEISI